MLSTGGDRQRAACRRALNRNQFASYETDKKGNDGTLGVDSGPMWTDMACVATTGGSGLIDQTSSVLDFKSSELCPFRDRYVRGSNGIDAEALIKLMKLLLFYAR